jgi:proline iminopeptidase
VDRFLFQDAQVAARNRAMWQESGLGNSGELARALEQKAPTALSAVLETLRQPVRILAGRHDRNVPLPGLARLAADLPDAWLQVFERGAHFPDLEETETYVNAVLKFLTDP